MSSGRTIFLALAILFALPLPATSARADSDELSKAYERCMAETVGDINMVGCAQQEFERQDARLNVAYKKLMEGLEDKRKVELRDAQRAWIKFRDLYGGFLLDPDGGTIARLNAALWYMQSTADRARQLEDAI